MLIYTHTSGMSLMSPVLGLPGPQPGPQNRTLNLFFHPSISLNLSIMYLRYPNYQVRVAKNIYWYTCILLAAIICQMEQVSQHLQSNFQGSRVNLSLIKLRLLDIHNKQKYWYKLVWIKILDIQTWMTLGSNVLIGCVSPYTTSSSSAWKVPIKIDQWCKYGKNL